MVNCKVHNVRFYKPKPEAIYCMALNTKYKKLAVSRADASIEIWNLAYVPCIERIIPNNADNNSIEGLAWCQGRLFSTGLHALLIEYDLFALSKKDIYTITGEAAYCLDVNKTQTCIGVGTEQGYINIFNVTSDGVEFEKFLDKQEGKILCLKYDSSGTFIVTGSLDVIRIWDVNTGHAIHKMSTGRAELQKPTIVWCLSITDDFTIISGDSRGKLTFWDGKIGAQVESYKSHKADILALTISEDNHTLYCAGVDPNIISYSKIYLKGENYKWVKSIQRRVNDHDIRALVLCQEKLYSAGIDGYLVCTYYPPRTLLKYPPVLQKNCVSLSIDARYILLRYSKHLEVWKLGSTDIETTQFDDGNTFPLSVEPKKLLLLQRTVKNDNGEEIKEGIICSDMSSDGKWIVFSTDTALRIFNFEYDESKGPKLNSLKSLPKECEVSVNVAFTPDDLELILAVRSGCIVVLDMVDKTLKQILETKSVLKDTVSHLKVSGCGNYLVTADCASNIVAYKKSGDKWKFYIKLAKYICPITAISIQRETPNLIIAYADHKIVEYNLLKKEFSKFSEKLNECRGKQWANKSFPIRNITFDPRNENIAILHDDSNIVVINKNKQIPESFAKIPKLTTSTLSPTDPHYLTPQKYAFHVIRKYKHLVHLEWLAADEMVAVEVSPLRILDQLPPCLYQNTFGTK